MLADLYERKADEALTTRDTAGAITLLEKSLRLDASDARVAERLKRLRSAPAMKSTEVKPR